MSTKDKGGSSSTSATTTEVYDDEAVTENDATDDDANASLEDGAATASSGDDGVPHHSSASEGTTSATFSAGADAGHDSQASEDPTPQDSGDGKSNNGDSSFSGAVGTAEDGESIHTVEKAPRDEEEEEKLIILPNFAQTKAEAIDDDDANNNIVSDTTLDEEEALHESDASRVHSVEAGNEEVVDAPSDDNDLDEEASPSDGSASESSGSAEESPNVKYDATTDDQAPLHDDSGSEKDESNSATDEEQNAPSTPSDDKEGSPTKANDAGASSEVEAEEGSSGTESSKNEAVDDGSSQDAKSNTESKPSASSTESSSSSKDPTDGNATESKESNTTTDAGSAPKDGDASSASATTGDNDDDGPRKIQLVDYASKLAGAQILEQSPSLKGASQLLTGDKDKYSIAPCEDKRYVVIGLSEDILVKQIKLSNYERYSSRVKEFQVLASQEYPVPDESYWNDIGTYEAKSKSGEQSFELKEPAWARYLKFRFLSHYGSEHYCTLSQIKVHGSTMLQGFHEQWIESEKKDRELVEQEQETVDKEGGEDLESNPVENGENNQEGGSSAGQEEGQPPPEVIEETPQDLRESEVAAEKGAAVDELQKEKEAPDGQAITESSPASSNDEVNKTEDETAPTQVGADEKEVTNESKQTTKPAPKESSTTDKDGSRDNDRKSEGGINETSEETSNDKRAQRENEGGDDDLSAVTEEVQVEEKEHDSKDGTIDGDSKPTPDDLEYGENVSDAVNMSDDQNSIKTEPKESIATLDGGEPIRNDSSIAAVNGVVKAASDALKNVKDAIRTATVTSGKTGESDKKDNATLDDASPSSSNGTEVELGSKPQSSDTAKKQGTPQTETVAKADTSQPPPKSDGSAVTTTKQEAAKSKGEEPSSKAGTENAAKTDSKPEKGTPILKEDTKASAGRDMLKRGTIAIPKSDGKADGASAGELFAKLSRRFPHAACMKDLDFQSFKSKTMLANAGSGDRPGGTSHGAKMEPIFKKITDEIKNVQITQTQYEQYISALKACYETVIFDVAQDIDTIQASVDQRLSSLERAVFLSEMRAKGSKSPAYDGVTKLLSKFPLSVSAFQLTDTSPTPEYSLFLAPCLAICLFFLIRRLTRRKTPEQTIQPPPAVKRESHNVAIGNSPISTAPAATPLRTTASSQEDVNSPAIQTSELLSTKVLLEKENAELINKLNATQDQLASVSEKLRTLETQHTTLQQEHESLQRKYSQLEQTVSSNDSQREVKHAVLGEGSVCSTPTPSIQSEPGLTNEVRTPATPTLGHSPLKSRFRKNKKKAKK